MSKKTQKEIPADMWLHVATDALARYAAAGGEFLLDGIYDEEAAELQIVIPIAPNDARLSPAFVVLFPFLPEATP